MPSSIPSIPRAVELAYRDLIALARRLPGLMVFAVLVAAATSVPYRLATPATDASRAGLLLMFAGGLVQLFLLTPVYIAVHRFIVCGESGARYALRPGDLRFQRYFMLWAAFSAATTGPSLLSGQGAALPLWGLVVVVVWLVAVMVAGVRLALLFPAIAVDAPGATIANALADSRGHAWRILIVGVLAAFPLLLVGALIARTVQASDGTLARLITDLSGSVIDSVVELMFLTVASRFYLWIGRRMNTPC